MVAALLRSRLLRVPHAIQSPLRCFHAVQSAVRWPVGHHRVGHKQQALLTSPQRSSASSQGSGDGFAFSKWLMQTTQYPGWNVPVGHFLTRPPFGPLIPDLSKPIWRLHAAMRAKLPHLAWLHAAFALSFCATFSDDLLKIRSFLTAMGASMFVFHFMFPEPVLVRIGWTVMLFLMHGRMVLLVARDRNLFSKMICSTARWPSIPTWKSSTRKHHPLPRLPTPPPACTINQNQSINWLSAFCAD